MRGDTEELPGYSPAPRRPRTDTGGFRREHRFSLKDRNGREWLSFKLNSRAVNTKNTPVFFDGDTVEGEVQLDLAKAERLKCLTITIRAATTAVGQEEERFLDKTEPVWTPASASEGKVVGRHTYPFAITIPRHTMIARVPRAKLERFALPPTFSERASPAYIDYKLYVTVRRNGLRVNHKLSTCFAFLPRAVAGPPSRLRTLAYTEGGAIPGPDADPEGWKVYDPFTITGTLPNGREVTAQCILAMATPLTYASNSHVPLLLTLRGADATTLDTLAGAPNVHLLRTILIGSRAAEKSGERRSTNTFVSSVAKAVFWPHEAGAAASEWGRDTDTAAEEVAIADGCEVRALRGELYVPRGSKQSFAFPRFACSYSIAFLPLQEPGLLPATASADPLFAESVTITMANAPGITPISQTPPGYDARNVGDYNVATGFLENGDQRFLQHTH